MTYYKIEKKKRKRKEKKRKEDDIIGALNKGVNASLTHKKNIAMSLKRINNFFINYVQPKTVEQAPTMIRTDD